MENLRTFVSPKFEDVERSRSEGKLVDERPMVQSKLVCFRILLYRLAGYLFFFETLHLSIGIPAYSQIYSVEQIHEKPAIFLPASLAPRLGQDVKQITGSPTSSSANLFHQLNVVLVFTRAYRKRQTRLVGMPVSAGNHLLQLGQLRLSRPDRLRRPDREWHWQFYLRGRSVEFLAHEPRERDIDAGPPNRSAVNSKVPVWGYEPAGARLPIFAPKINLADRQRNVVESDFSGNSRHTLAIRICCCRPATARRRLPWR